MDLTNYHLFSGGAKGADTAWEHIGRVYGFSNFTHFTTRDIERAKKLDTYYTFEKKYETVCKFLGRPILDNNSYVGKLVRRDLMQADAGEAVYAIADLVKPGERGRKEFINKQSYHTVEGGTAYACAHAILQNKPCYVYNQLDYSAEIGWYTWNYELNDFKSCDLPILSKLYTGIGSVDLKDNGYDAIKQVYSKTIETLKIN